MSIQHSDPITPPAPRTTAAVDSDAESRLRDVLDPNYPLERLVAEATELTASRGGEMMLNRPAAGNRQILFYAPLYLANYCQNACVYCGFQSNRSIPRESLTLAKATQQLGFMRRRGFHHVLLVAGDDPRRMTPEYFAEIISSMCDDGFVPSVEIAPQSVESYTAMVAAGLSGVTLFQETYDRERYKTYHPRGTKANYDWRLEGPHRAAAAGAAQLGLGVLLGLGDPVEELAAMIVQARQLTTDHPDLRIAFNLPRIHRAPDGFAIPFPVSDEQFVRLYCSLRVAVPSANLVLSTRESASLRDRLAGICITQMSAESSTAPGGYEDSPMPVTEDDGDGRQFEISDDRPAGEVAAALASQGIATVWK